MKTIFALCILLAATSSFAHEGGSFGRIICTQNSDFSPLDGTKLAMTLDQQGQGRYYNLTVYEKAVGSNGQHRIILQDRLHLTTEDVMARFRARGERASVMIYMDELNQSNLTLPGGRSVTMTCRTNR